MAECGGRAVLVGAGAASAATGLAGLSTEVQVWETEGYRPAAWSAALAPVMAREPVVVLPASADGRDLAPRLAHRLGRPLLAGAIEVTPDRVVDRPLGRPRGRGRGPARPSSSPPCSPACGASRVPARSSRRWSTSTSRRRPPTKRTTRARPSTPSCSRSSRPTRRPWTWPRRPASWPGARASSRRRASSSWPPSAEALGASLGATRVVTDRGWVGHERQIGTTGVVVDPRLYVAFGISGAVQHTSGLGQPDHIISVNTDPYCPMMQLADLAVVSDANAVLDELVARLAPPAAPTTRGRPVPDVDVIVVGAGPAGADRGADPRPGRAQRRAARAGAVPRLQEHVRRGRLPAGPRRAHPAVVGGGADPALGDAALDHGADGPAGPHRRLPHGGLGRGALQRRHRLPAGLGRLAGRPGRGGGRPARLLDHGDRAAAGRTARGRRAHRPAGRRADGLRRHRRATASTASWPRRPGSTATSTRAATRSGSRRRWPCRRRSSTSASASAVVTASTSR